MTNTEYSDKPWMLPPQRELTFINANIVDPVSGKLIKDTQVTISEGRISRVWCAKDDTEIEQLRKSSTIIDLKGTYLCPGLIDAHVHVRQPQVNKASRIHTRQSLNQ